MPKRKGQKEDLRAKEIKLDKKAQQALAYLSGIPPSEEEALIEAIALTKEENIEFDRLLSIWLKLQEAEIKEIGRTLMEVLQRLKLTSKRVRERIESPNYLCLVRKSFRNWSAAESEQKRVLVRNLLANAASRTTSPDFALLMFIDWLDKYSDEHFALMRTIFAFLPEGLTRHEIWEVLHPDRELPAEDSAEADMFKMLILDLTTGYVIRQPREKNFYGSFVRSKPARAASPEANISAFEDTKKYVLTELGKQFVAYTMEETPPEETEEKETSEIPGSPEETPSEI